MAAHVFEEIIDLNMDEIAIMDPQPGITESCICHGIAFSSRVALLEHQVNHYAEMSRKTEINAQIWKDALVRRIDIGGRTLDTYVKWEDQQYRQLIQEREALNQEKREHVAELQLLKERYQTYGEMVRETEESHRAVAERQAKRAQFLHQTALEIELRQKDMLQMLPEALDYEQ